jgi:alkylhydroperoxidase/carboxymuconolactone decarboxylase family protein YurZ
MRHKNEKEEVKEETETSFGDRIKCKNKIQAIGLLAVPVLRYGFGIVNWHQEERQKLDRKTRELLTILDSIAQKQKWISCMFPDNRKEGV